MTEPPHDGSERFAVFVDEMPCLDGGTWSCVSLLPPPMGMQLARSSEVIGTVLDSLRWRRHDAGVVLMVPWVTRAVREIAIAIRRRFPSCPVRVLELRHGGRSCARLRRFVRREGISWPIATLNPVRRMLKLRWSD